MCIYTYIYIYIYIHIYLSGVLPVRGVPALPPGRRPRALDGRPLSCQLL